MISVCLLVKDGEKRLKEVLEALSAFKEVLVVDTGSTDRSLEIAATFPNVRILHDTLNEGGFGPLRNRAAAHATYPWILAVDSDEILSPELCKEIFELPLAEEERIYAIHSHNFYRGKWIRGCGWGGRTPIRLYHRERTAFCPAKVHEAIERRSLQLITLTHPLFHIPYTCLSDFLIKLERYSTLFAEQHCGKLPSSPLKAIAHGLFAFFKSYFLKNGWRLGYEGFLISVYNAHAAFYKYLKLYEYNLDRAPIPSDREREACESSKAL